ncbi:uncharacterized [Tachysurus ichikawai]
MHMQCSSSFDLQGVSNIRPLSGLCIRHPSPSPPGHSQTCRHFVLGCERTVTELSDRRQETEILPAVRNEVDTKDTGCQRGCAALIKGGKKAQYSVG